MGTIKRILITGSNGLLGQKIVSELMSANHEFLATSKGDNRNPNCPDSLYMSMDIESAQEINTVFNHFNPSHVIHTAALTNVDYCELNPEECESVNVKATSLLFEACKTISAHFQLLSTDFVFDGEKGNYSETDEINPLSIYAESKAKAEKLLLQSEFANWSIVRTIIVYGLGHNLSRSNLIVWAKQALENNQEINIIDDQFRAPTYAPDLAKACLSIVEKNKTGIYHISGPETYSIYELVLKIAETFNLNSQLIRRISSDTLSQPAKRPPKTGFDLSKAYSELDYKPQKFETSLKEMFRD